MARWVAISVDPYTFVVPDLGLHYLHKPVLQG